jgi:hypothetical protein
MKKQKSIRSKSIKKPKSIKKSIRSRTIKKQKSIKKSPRSKTIKKQKSIKKSPRSKTIKKQKSIKKSPHSKTIKKQKSDNIIHIIKDDKNLFKVKINVDDNGYNLCLTYIGNDKTVNEKIKNGVASIYQGINKDIIDPSNVCLFVIYFSIENGQYGKNKIYYDSFLKMFYNLSYRYGLDKEEPFNNLKGLGQTLLCLLINKAIQDKKLSLNYKMILEASGEIKDKNMIGLINKYENLGFKVVYPDTLQIDIEQGNVLMISDINNIHNTCNIMTPHNTKFILSNEPINELEYADYY